MGRTIASWFIRFAVAAAVYITVVSIWTKQAQGWEGLGMFVAGLVFGLIAAVMWWAALAVGHRIVAGLPRLLLHPVLVVVLFVGATVFMVGIVMETTWELLWHDLRPFVGLVAAATITDAVIGLLLWRWIPPRRSAA